MVLFQDVSIVRKLTWITTLASLTALVVASVALAWYERHTFRTDLVGRLQTQARIVGFNTPSPLLFDDAEAAATILASMKAVPRVVSAGIVTPSAGLFASYWREGEQPGAALVPSAPLAG